jgi:hypothetical protein
MASANKEIPGIPSEEGGAASERLIKRSMGQSEVAYQALANALPQGRLDL